MAMVASLPASERTVSLNPALLDKKNRVAGIALRVDPLFFSDVDDFPPRTDLLKKCLYVELAFCGRHRQILRLSLSCRSSYQETR
jgi:hypothetical protein